MFSNNEGISEVFLILIQKNVEKGTLRAANTEFLIFVEYVLTLKKELLWTYDLCVSALLLQLIFSHEKNILRGNSHPAN